MIIQHNSQDLHSNDEHSLGRNCMNHRNKLNLSGDWNNCIDYENKHFADQCSLTTFRENDGSEIYDRSNNFFNKLNMEEPQPNVLKCPDVYVDVKVHLSQLYIEQPEIIIIIRNRICEMCDGTGYVYHNGDDHKNENNNPLSLAATKPELMPSTSISTTLSPWKDNLNIGNMNNNNNTCDNIMDCTCYNDTDNDIMIQNYDIFDVSDDENQNVIHPFGICDDLNEAQAAQQHKKCETCEGFGVIPKKKELLLQTQGRKQNDIVIFYGEGDEVMGKMPGDVIITIHEIPHPCFKREGGNLFVKKAIDFRQAIFKCDLYIEHLDLRVLRIKQNEIISPYQVKCVKNEGMPYYQDGLKRHGDMFVQFEIKLPPQHRLNPYMLQILSQILDKGPKDPLEEKLSEHVICDVELYDVRLPSLSSFQNGNENNKAPVSNDDNAKINK